MLKVKKIGSYAKRPLYILELNRKTLIRLTVMVCEVYLLSVIFKGHVPKIGNPGASALVVGVLGAVLLFIIAYAMVSKQTRWGKIYLGVSFSMLLGLCVVVVLF